MKVMSMCLSRRITAGLMAGLMCCLPLSDPQAQVALGLGGGASLAGAATVAGTTHVGGTASVAAATALAAGSSIAAGSAIAAGSVVNGSPCGAAIGLTESVSGAGGTTL